MPVRFVREEPLIFERNRGRARRGRFQLPAKSLPGEVSIPERFTKGDVLDIPDLGELEVVSHFHRLSQLNFGVDEGLYPLGSCTMKYNPRVCEDAARLEGLVNLHPMQGEEQVQGALELLWELEQLLVKVTGMSAVTFQPAAGAHGELTALLMMRKALEERGENRHKVIIPDSAHGTNPASASLAGFQAVEIASTSDGTLDLDKLGSLVDDDTVCLMVTVPNTLGLFEPKIAEAAEILHSRGAFLYVDGANLNAFAGRALPGKMGADALHLNLHKTFGTPHGGGGPGAGPLAVAESLKPYLPCPRVVREDGGFRILWSDERSIGPVRAFFANFLVAVRAFVWLQCMGRDGLEASSAVAVLYANLIKKRLEPFFNVPYPARPMHEVVFDDSKQRSHGVTNVDICKRLLDYGFHPPTMSFPLVVHGALMVEPTESWPPEEVEAFCEAMRKIAEEAEKDPELLKGAPHNCPVARVDEVGAARKPVLRWRRDDPKA